MMNQTILQYYKNIAFSAAAQVVRGKCEYVPIDAIAPVKSSVMFSMYGLCMQTGTDHEMI